MTYLFANVPIAIILIIAILILLFGDYRKSLIILCCIPLLGVGIVGAMLISGKTFTFCAIVGAIGLVGMMMKNCIVLMDEINDQIASGKGPDEAAGMSDRNDVLKVEVKVNEGALNLKRTENAVRLAKMNLCHYIGYPLDSEVDVAESSLPESGSVSGSADISGRPEYQMLDKKVQAAAQQVRMTRTDALPQTGIFAGYGYTHGLTVSSLTSTASSPGSRTSKLQAI